MIERPTGGVNDFYYWCVDVMHSLAELTNTTYEEINTIVFVIIQPALIIIFMCLWLREKYEGNTNRKRV